MSLFPLTHFQQNEKSKGREKLRQVYHEGAKRKVLTTTFPTICLPQLMRLKKLINSEKEIFTRICFCDFVANSKKYRFPKIKSRQGYYQNKVK